MTKTYTITLSEAEEKALSTVVYDTEEWIQNAIHERCRVAIEEIVQFEVQRLLAEGKPITGSREDIVLAASLESAKERQSRLEEEYNNLHKNKQG